VYSSWDNFLKHFVFQDMLVACIASNLAVAADQKVSAASMARFLEWLEHVPKVSTCRGR